MAEEQQLERKVEDMEPRRDDQQADKHAAAAGSGGETGDPSGLDQLRSHVSPFIYGKPFADPGLAGGKQSAHDPSGDCANDPPAAAGSGGETGAVSGLDQLRSHVSPFILGKPFADPGLGGGKQPAHDPSGNDAADPPADGAGSN